MQKATYTRLDGTTVEVEYDEEAPCCVCGLPVVSASVGGTMLCPWCDSGFYRNGARWESRDLLDRERLRRKAREAAGMKEPEIKNGQ